jgi:pSer/pThr/pTyr-binding forkhead associated (FHA) protein
MRDGRTRLAPRTPHPEELDEYLLVFDPRLVVVEGASAGCQYPLDRERLIIGRGPDVDLAFEDPEMSRQHVILDFRRGAFRLRDLDSTNGTLLNGNRVHSGELKHGDRVDVGGLGFQILIEEREQEPEAYELPSEI